MTIAEHATERPPDLPFSPSRGSTSWVVAAASLPAILYVLYVYRYSVNVPFIDDWQLMPIVSAALHGHLDLQALWKQYVESREVTGRLVFMGFGLVDHLNERAVMLFSAG